MPYRKRQPRPPLLTRILYIGTEALFLLFLLGFNLLITGCGQVQIKDSEWYGSLGSQGAAGVHTLTPATEVLNLQQWAVRWDDLSHPLVCTSTDTLAEWKGDIEKLCSFEQDCTYQVKQAVSAFYSKINAAHVAATAAAKNSQQKATPK